MVQFIFHISDVHIMEKNYCNIRHSFSILLSRISRDDLLVIAGDIFETKCTLTTEDIHLFFELINSLESSCVNTIIIPGNHDININTELSLDNISILLDNHYKYVKCISKTCVYPYENIDFFIYSPIDTLIPMKSDNISRIKIALIHETLPNSMYDNGIVIKTTSNSSRYTDLNIYDIVMLGDIHKPQFLAKNMAYSGSFVQKNKGEGINHGYILWNTGDFTGSHVFIPLKQLYLTLKLSSIYTNDISNYSFPDTNDSEIRHLTLIVDISISNDLLTQIKSDISNRYKKDIDYVKFDNITSQNIDNNCKIINLNCEHIKNNSEFKSELTRIKNLENSSDLVKKLHQNYIKDINTTKGSMYTLKKLQWDNVFCYGKDNSIDFDNINGICVLNGPNRIGKSSIIDILTLVLFNKNNRGSDILNVNACSGRISCTFISNNIEYQVVLTLTNSSKKCMLLENNINISKDSIVNTYKFISNLVGNYNEFILLTTALQNRKYFVDLSKEDINTVLCKLIDIEYIQDIEVKAKEHLNSIKREKNTLISSMIETYEVTDCQDIRALHKQLSEELINLQKQTICHAKNLQNIPKYEVCDLPVKTYDSDYILEDNDTIQKYHIYKHLLPKDYMRWKNVSDAEDYSNKSPIKIYPRKTNYSIEYINSYIYKDNFSNLISDKDSSIYRHILINLDRSKNLANDLEKYVYYLNNKDNLKDDLKDNYEQDLITSNIHLYLQKFPFIKTSYVNLSEFIGNLNDEIKQASSLFKVTKMKTSHPTEYIMECNYDVVSLQSSIKHLESKVPFKQLSDTLVYNHECSSCTQNKININEIIQSTEDLDNIIKFKHQIDIMDDKKSLINQDKNNSIYIWNLYNYYICKYNEIIRKDRDDIMYDKDQIKNQHINDCIDKWNSYNYFKYKSIYDKYTDYTNKKDRYDKDVCKYNIYLEAKNIINTNKIHKESIDEINIKIKSIQTEINQYDKIIKETDIKLYNYQKATEHNSQLKQRIYNIDTDIDVYTEYLQYIDYKKVQLYSLKSICIHLNKMCNDILYKISDFQILFEYDKNISIKTIEKGKQICAKLSSGFQKFIIDLLMRIVLTELYTITPSIIFIDEGFGTLDRDNLNNICNCISSLKPNFKSIFLITHMEEIKSYADICLNIQKINGLSSIQMIQVQEVEEKSTDFIDIISDKEIFCRACNKTIKSSKDKHLQAKTYQNIHNKFVT